jgi:hypothetical protein
LLFFGVLPTAILRLHNSNLTPTISPRRQGFDLPTQSPPQGEWPSQLNDNHASEAARSLKEEGLQEEFAGWRTDLAKPIDRRGR